MAETDLSLHCCKPHREDNTVEFNGHDDALCIVMFSDSGMVALDHASEEKLRQFLYRRHRRLVGARKARSPKTPDHLQRVINPSPALKQALKSLLEDVQPDQRL